MNIILLSSGWLRNWRIRVILDRFRKLSVKVFINFALYKLLQFLCLCELKMGSLQQGWGSGFGKKKNGSGALYLKRREIFKSLKNEYFRLYLKASFLFAYFWCQKSSVIPRILPGPGWFSESRTSIWYVWQQEYKNKKEGFKNDLNIHSIDFLKSTCVRVTDP